MEEGKEARDLIYKLWDGIKEKKWEAVRALLADEFEAYWPQSDETIPTPEAFIEINRNYPGIHQINVLDLNYQYDRWDKTHTVISQVLIKSNMPDGKKITVFGISIFEIRYERVIGVMEYWADTYPAPEWRKQYVEIRKTGWLRE